MAAARAAAAEAPACSPAAALQKSVVHSPQWTTSFSVFISRNVHSVPPPPKPHRPFALPPSRPLIRMHPPSHSTVAMVALPSRNWLQPRMASSTWSPCRSEMGARIKIHRGKWDSDLVDAAHVAQAVLVALDGTGAAWVRTSEEEREGEQHAPRRARAAPHDHGRAALCAAVYALPTNSALIHELSSHVAPHGVELPRDEDPGVDGGARGGGGRGASSGRNAAADPVGPVAGGACVACP